MDAESKQKVVDFIHEFQKDNPKVSFDVCLAAVAVSMKRNKGYERVLFHAVPNGGIEVTFRKPDGNLIGAVLFDHYSMLLKYHNNDLELPDGTKTYADTSMRMTKQIVDDIVTDINRG